MTNKPAQKAELVPKTEPAFLPPILAGRFTPDMRKRVEQFYFSVASIFESWVARRGSPHTQRAYRADVMSFVRFLKIEWPGESTSLLSAGVKDVQAFRDLLLEKNAAPKTINRRISSVSSFYKYLAARRRPSSGFRSPFLIRPMRNSSPANRPTRATRRGR